MLPLASADPCHPPASESICESGRETRPLRGERPQPPAGVTELAVSRFWHQALLYICSFHGFLFPSRNGY